MRRCCAGCPAVGAPPKRPWLFEGTWDEGRAAFSRRGRRLALCNRESAVVSPPRSAVARARRPCASPQHHYPAVAHRSPGERLVRRPAKLTDHKNNTLDTTVSAARAPPQLRAPRGAPARSPRRSAARRGGRRGPARTAAARGARLPLSDHSRREPRHPPRRL